MYVYVGCGFSQCMSAMLAYLPPCNVCRFSASYFYVCQLRVLQMYACLPVMYAVDFQMYGRFRVCQLRVLPMYVRTVYLPPCCFYVCQRRALQMYVRNVCLPSCNRYCCFPSVCQPRFLQIYALFPLFSKCMVVSVNALFPLSSTCMSAGLQCLPASMLFSKNVCRRCNNLSPECAPPS